MRSLSARRPASLELDDGRTIRARGVELRPDWTTWSVADAPDVPGTRVETMSVRFVDLSPSFPRLAGRATAGVVAGALLGLWLVELEGNVDLTRGELPFLSLPAVLGLLIGVSAADEDYVVVGAVPPEP